MPDFVGFVLTFHSQNISGDEFATNDHVALDQVIAHLITKGLPIVRLSSVAKALLQGSRLPRRFAALTFDDGPDYDWLPVKHPSCGLQASMGEILKKYGRRWGLGAPRATATSFVIASPEARSQITGPPSANPDRMSDQWWRTAQQSGFLDIGTHGWDHVHPSVVAMKDRPHLIEAFHKVNDKAEADLQVRSAVEFIQSKAGPTAGKLYAYPYGQVSDYLVNEYFPSQRWVDAAFTTEGVPLTRDKSIWRLPRYVCGWHFKSLSDLDQLLAE